MKTTYRLKELSKFSYLRSFLALFALISLPVWGFEVAAKKDKVNVHQEPNKSSSVLKVLKKGESLAALDRKGMYWQVKLQSGDTGYVSFTKVKRQAGKSDALAEAIQNAAKSSRDMDQIKTARARSAVMGVRGLDESSETSNAGNSRPNLRLVYAMEDLEVENSEVDKIGDLIASEVEARML